MSKFTDKLHELREQIDAKGTPEEQDAELEHLEDFVPTAHGTVEGLRGFVHEVVEELRGHGDAEEAEAAEAAGETVPATREEAEAEGEAEPAGEAQE